MWRNFIHRLVMCLPVAPYRFGTEEDYAPSSSTGACNPVGETSCVNSSATGNGAEKLKNRLILRFNRCALILVPAFTGYVFCTNPMTNGDVGIDSGRGSESGQDIDSLK